MSYILFNNCCCIDGCEEPIDDNFLFEGLCTEHGKAWYAGKLEHPVMGFKYEDDIHTNEDEEKDIVEEISIKVPNQETVDEKKDKSNSVKIGNIPGYPDQEFKRVSQIAKDAILKEKILRQTVMENDQMKDDPEEQPGKSATQVIEDAMRFFPGKIYRPFNEAQPVPISFEKYKEIYEILKLKSKEDIRSIENQALFYIIRGMKADGLVQELMEDIAE